MVVEKCFFWKNALEKSSIGLWSLGGGMGPSYGACSAGAPGKQQVLQGLGSD